MTFHERGNMLKALALHLREHLDYFYTISYQTGATRADSWIDIEGGIGNLFANASLRRKFPDQPFCIDGESHSLSRQHSFAGTKAKLDTLLKDVDYANFAMDKWMKEFKFDIEKEFPDIKARIDYLKSEEIKVDKMKESIDYSLNRADTVLKKLF